MYWIISTLVNVWYIFGALTFAKISKQNLVLANFVLQKSKKYIRTFLKLFTGFSSKISLTNF
jgi:hypothetical protein